MSPKSHTSKQNLVSSNVTRNGKAYFFGGAPLDALLHVAYVQIFWILGVEVGDDVHPPARETKRVGRRAKCKREDNRGLLFTVDGRVLPAGFSDQDPVFYLVGGQRTPSKVQHYILFEHIPHYVLH